MTGFTDVLRQELTGTSIHVMGVYPGFINTAMTLPFVRPGSWKSKMGKDPEKMAAAILKSASLPESRAVLSLVCSLADSAASLVSEVGRSLGAKGTSMTTLTDGWVWVPFTVDKKFDGYRLDRFLAGRLESYTRARVQKILWNRVSREMINWCAQARKFVPGITSASLTLVNRKRHFPKMLTSLFSLKMMIS